MSNVPTAKVTGKHQRRLSNFLLDKQLQLRYVLVVVTVSALIAGVLGFLIYQQERAASLALQPGLSALNPDLAQVSADLAAGDSSLIVKMIGAGIGLALILSLYLVVMTHKVAGPLFKVSMYFDRMATGRLGSVTALRDGDMLQDFYQSFHTAHDAMRKRQADDLDDLAAVAATMATQDEAASKALLAYVDERRTLLA